MRRLFPMSMILLMALASAGARADDDNAAAVARGRRLFLQCASCHQVAPSAAVKIGPTLQGVVGRPVASVPGYGYSADLKAQQFDWDETHLDRWLAAPTQVAPGTTMAFIGLPQPADRNAVIAYLKTLK
jgi:cytochrome c